MKQNQPEVVTLLVDNEFGVLTRVTALIRRAGWNIRSLAVAETDTPEISRLTMDLECRHNTLEYLLGRLKRQSSVRRIDIFSPETQVAQELCIVRVTATDPAAVDALCTACKAEILSQDGGEAVLAFHCDAHQTEDLLQQCRAVGLLELSRSGSITLQKRGQ